MSNALKNESDCCFHPVQWLSVKETGRQLVALQEPCFQQETALRIDWLKRGHCAEVNEKKKRGWHFVPPSCIIIEIK